LAATENLDLEKIKRCWDALTYTISREKMSVATYLHEGTPVEFKDFKLIIGFPKKCAFQKETLEDKNNIQLVERIFFERFKKHIHVQYKILDDYKPKEEEQLIKDALDTFKGKVVSRWYNE